ncbi:uncharacterized protein MCYG_05921 [Microsporum canis CBS 113480]|uniref:Uncharacterized protein n=1 Tax=Arthroderma otae (strain ATCC MYA-4605 / CBS 113480) TaxID=554155 RepID=C5FT99_ARTOC|nr:uncharacterized protein MCYG_05921 [Microsporum canis CBS 113480]EEQ33102.1 predicted protein [Microsporum canis CBS 113480]
MEETEDEEKAEDGRSWELTRSANTVSLFLLLFLLSTPTASPYSTTPSTAYYLYCLLPLLPTTSTAYYLYCLLPLPQAHDMTPYHHQHTITTTSIPSPPPPPKDSPTPLDFLLIPNGVLFNSKTSSLPPPPLLPGGFKL